MVFAQERFHQEVGAEKFKTMIHLPLVQEKGMLYEKENIDAAIFFRDCNGDLETKR